MLLSGGLRHVRRPSTQDEVGLYNTNSNQVA
jgi:hypothetical protein